MAAEDVNAINCGTNIDCNLMEQQPERIYKNILLKEKKVK